MTAFIATRNDAAFRAKRPSPLFWLFLGLLGAALALTPAPSISQTTPKATPEIPKLALCDYTIYSGGVGSEIDDARRNVFDLICDFSPMLVQCIHDVTTTKAVLGSATAWPGPVICVGAWSRARSPRDVSYHVEGVSRAGQNVYFAGLTINTVDSAGLILEPASRVKFLEKHFTFAVAAAIAKVYGLPAITPKQAIGDGREELRSILRMAEIAVVAQSLSGTQR